MTAESSPSTNHDSGLDSTSAQDVPAEQPSERSSDNRSRSEDPDEIPSPDVDQISFRSFNPYGQPKSIREINETIKAELMRSHPANAGFIYGFTHAVIVFARLGTGPLIHVDLIKLGRTDNVQRRMHQWRKLCKYEPHLAFAHYMPHHQRIERIVHHQLHNARLREHLGCSGCGARHTEWFRAGAAHAESLVKMWQDFTRSGPYDEFGDLLPSWLGRLQRGDLDDPDCWISFTQGSVSTMPDNVDAESEDDSHPELEAEPSGDSHAPEDTK